MPMGEVGLPLRILALREGSALAYAPVGEVTAPGQVSLSGDEGALSRGSTQSRHESVWRDWFADWTFAFAATAQYRVCRARAECGVFTVPGAQAFGVSWGSCPKLVSADSALRCRINRRFGNILTSCDALAEEIGAVNTVTVERDGSLHGSNTDYIGVLRALESRMKLAKSRVLIFGAGGSARAAAFALSARGRGRRDLCAARGGGAGAGAGLWWRNRAAARAAYRKI